MPSPGQRCVALGVIAFIGVAAVRPALAQDAPAEGGPVVTVPPAPPEAAPAPNPNAGWQQPPPAPGYPPYGYPPGQYPPNAYPPGQYPPPYATYPQGPPTMVHRARKGLVIGGAVTFGVSWGLAALISSILVDSSSGCTGSCRDSANVFWVPIIGPVWADARDPGSDGRGLFILWSAAELAGVVMFAFGVAGHDVPAYRVADGGPTLQLTPLLAKDSSGMALTARW